MASMQDLERNSGGFDKRRRRRRRRRVYAQQPPGDAALAIVVISTLAVLALQLTVWAFLSNPYRNGYVEGVCVVFLLFGPSICSVAQCSFLKLRCYKYWWARQGKFGQAQTIDSDFFPSAPLFSLTLHPLWFTS